MRGGQRVGRGCLCGEPKPPFPIDGRVLSHLPLVAQAEVKYVMERSPPLAPVAFIRAEAAPGQAAGGGPVEELLDAYEAAGRLPKGAPPGFRDVS